MPLVCASRRRSGDVSPVISSARMAVPCMRCASHARIAAGFERARALPAVAAAPAATAGAVPETLAATALVTVPVTVPVTAPVREVLYLIAEGQDIAAARKILHLWCVPGRLNVVVTVPPAAAIAIVIARADQIRTCYGLQEVPVDIFNWFGIFFNKTS